jgi:hypothetical protein
LKEKDSAVRGQDFEKAGSLRDREMELKAQISAITSAKREEDKAETEAGSGPVVRPPTPPPRHHPQPAPIWSSPSSPPFAVSSGLLCRARGLGCFRYSMVNVHRKIPRAAFDPLAVGCSPRCPSLPTPRCAQASRACC